MCIALLECVLSGSITYDPNQEFIVARTQMPKRPTGSYKVSGPR